MHTGHMYPCVRQQTEQQLFLRREFCNDTQQNILKDYTTDIEHKEGDTVNIILGHI